MLVYCPVIASIKPSLIQSVIRSNRLPINQPLTEQAGKQRNQRCTNQSDTSACHKLFHTQIGVGNRLDGGRRRVKKYLWSFFRTAPAGQVRL